MSNCGEYNLNIKYVYNFTSIFQYICNITTWGELVSESGASCLRVSLMWGELSCVQTFRPKLVSPEVLDQEQFACVISLIFLIFLKHNPLMNFS